MVVRVDEDQVGGDTLLTLQIQEIRDWYPASVREVAGRWEQGLRGLLGLAGGFGVVGSSLAADRFAISTRVTVGVLFAVVMVAAGLGLILTMSAAYGSVRLVPTPTSASELTAMRWRHAERARHQLVWGRRLAVAALVVFAASITVAWIGPRDEPTPDEGAGTDDTPSLQTP